jgi:hypothetical protein
MKKRFLALTLALTMAMGMTMTAFAAEDGTEVTEASEPKTGTTIISYETTESYTVTLPADTALETKTDDGYTGTGEVEAKDVLLKDGSTLEISLASTNNFNLQYGTSNPSKIAYTIYSLVDSEEETVDEQGVKVTGGEAFLTVAPKTDGNGGVASGKTTLTYAATKTAIEEATKAGKHTDTLTFTITVKGSDTIEEAEVGGSDV